MASYGDNKKFNSIQPFQRELSSHAFNYLWDTGDNTWRPLTAGDYGDITVAIQSQKLSIDMRTGLAGLTGVDGITIGSGGALPITDHGGSLTIDDGGGSITVDGIVGINQPIAITDNSGSLTIDDGGSSLTIDGSLGQSGNWFINQSGDWFVRQTGDWVVSIAGGVLDVRVTGQPIEVSGEVGITGNVNATILNPITEFSITGTASKFVSSTVSSSGSTSAVLIEPYSNHTYQIIFEGPAGAQDIGDGAKVKIEATLDNDKNYFSIAEFLINRSGTLQLPDLWSIGYDGITGGCVFGESYAFKYGRVTISDYTSGSFTILEQHNL